MTNEELSRQTAQLVPDRVLMRRRRKRPRIHPACGPGAPIVSGVICLAR